MISNRVDQRSQQFAGCADPSGKRRTIEVDAFAGIDLRLPVERLVSGAGELHPRALPEPYVNLSAHTAPSVEPRPYRNDQ